MQDRNSLVEMLGYCRPEGSSAQQAFCDTYLRPVFGTPDKMGNYIRKVGKDPNICFAAHHDTVHSESGRQVVQVVGDTAMLPTKSKSKCLGADCTTGVWLILGMIEAGVEGVYVVHAAEEIGCLGSEYIVKRNPKWLNGIDAVISFDRYGTDSIITHQMGCRTASDEFSESLSEILNMPSMVADPGGSYTDSNEYAETIKECTNISVGYYSQHSSNETQDLDFAEVLLERLIDAKWGNLEFFRDPSDIDYYDSYYSNYYGNRGHSSLIYDPAYDTGVTNPPRTQDSNIDVRFVKYLIEKHPTKMAELLVENWGLTPDGILDDLGIANDEGIVDEYLWYYG